MPHDAFTYCAMRQYIDCTKIVPVQYDGRRTTSIGQPAMRQIAYETFDVFAEKRFGGNPLAVIADARELSSAEMQSIATEFNYTESTFILPPENPSNTAR